MKKVASSLLAVSLGLMLYPMVAHARSKNPNTQMQSQKEAQKTWKAYNKGQKKAQKQQLKSQKKQMKQFKNTHNSTTTVT